GVMGYPTGPVITTSDSKTSWQSYQNGYIIWGDNSGAWESKGAIRDRWAQLGYQNGTAGFPIDNERYDPNTNTWSQRYQNGVIYYSDPLGAWFTK
ncbi:MAG: lysozyme M1, partial [Candidatus Saccharibacteria bacterium]